MKFLLPVPSALVKAGLETRLKETFKLIVASKFGALKYLRG
jgi:hypothetical protein